MWARSLAQRSPAAFEAGEIGEVEESSVSLGDGAQRDHVGDGAHRGGAASRLRWGARFSAAGSGRPSGPGFNEALVYDPASSIKIVVAISLLQRIEDGAAFNLDTSITHFTGLSGSCPTGDGFAVSETLRNFVMFLMPEFSDNAATRTLIDFLGGFAAMNATASGIGMTSTNMVVYPGCNVTNTMTQVDAALLYEGVADGTLISAANRAELFAAMPSDAGDFSGTLGAAQFIADAEAAAAGVPAAATELFKSELALHYKAGNDIWCDPICLSSYSISGLAEIPRCSGQSQTTGHYAWGLFISNGTSDIDTANTFFANQAEPLRRPIREALATLASCTATGETGAPCGNNGDCDSFVCSGGVCQPASCAPTCNQGAPCGSDADCGSDVCGESGTCQAPACSPSCSTGEVCGNNGDCSSFVCAHNQCAPAQCAPTCAVGAPCGSNGDCASRICDDGICARPACSPRCRARSVCSDNGDCASRQCVNNRCR